MIRYFIKRAGKNLSASRRRELERANEFATPSRDEMSPASRRARAVKTFDRRRSGAVGVFSSPSKSGFQTTPLDGL